MIRPGLVSVTFRNLPPLEIVRLVAVSGLEAIEWGGDVHVPHGDLAQARAVRQMTEDAGLVVAAYGSYYRVGASEAEGLAFESVLATAVELGAPTARVWAGRKGSHEADDAYRAAVAEDSRRIAAMAASEGMTISFEFHGGTLTDSGASAVALLKAVGHEAVRCYWQPAVGASDPERLASLHDVLPYLSNLHVFHWGPKGERYPLRDGGALWRAAFGTVAAQASSTTHFALLEFVEADSPETFARDAATLRTLTC